MILDVVLQKDFWTCWCLLCRKLVVSGSSSAIPYHYKFVFSLGILCIFKIFFSRPGSAVLGFSQNYGISCWLLWSASFRSDWSCKQPVLCQAACPLHSCACLNSFAAGDIWEGWYRCVSAVCYIAPASSLRASALCLYPNTLGREFPSPAVLCVTFWISRYLCIVSLLGYVRISVWLKVSVEEETEILCLVHFIL